MNYSQIHIDIYSTQTTSIISTFTSLGFFSSQSSKMTNKDLGACFVQYPKAAASSQKSQADFSSLTSLNTISSAFQNLARRVYFLFTLCCSAYSSQSSPKDWEIIAFNKIWFSIMMQIMMRMALYHVPERRWEVQSSRVINWRALMKATSILDQV